MKSETVDAEDFIGRLCDESRNGFGFIPLIGAGLSAPSGVPIILEIRDYVRRCIARALGLDHKNAWSPENGRGTLEFFQFRRWVPGQDDWPPFGDPQIYERDTVDWMARLGRVINEMVRQSQFSASEFDKKELSIFQEAYGAMSEWRSSLLFLSRLQVYPNNQISPDNKNVYDLTYKFRTHG